VTLKITQVTLEVAIDRLHKGHFNISSSHMSVPETNIVSDLLFLYDIINDGHYNRIGSI
jgi:hypothetical protein